MPGLLDFLNTDEGRLGIGLLSAGMAGPTPPGQRLAQVFQGLDEFKQGQMRNKLLQSQMSENEAQAAYRKVQADQAGRKQEMLAGLLGNLGAASTGGGINMGAPSGGGLARMSLDQIAALKAQGIDLMDAWKLGKEGFKRSAGDYYEGVDGSTKYMPKLGEGMGVVNGQVQNAPGYAASNAQTKGMEAGAVEAAKYPYAVGQDAAKQRLGAQLDPLKTFNPQTGREEYTPRAQVAQPQFAGPGYAGGSAQNAAPEQLRILQNELGKLPAGHPDRPALMREMQRLGGGQSGAYAAGPSQAEAVQAEADRVRAVDGARADVVRDTAKQTAARMATENISNADRAMELLKLGPTGSGLGELSDKAAAFMGQATPGGNIAAKLDIIAAGMVKNVPRFEGPQSDKDVDQYKAAAGRLADRGVPIGQRLEAAAEIKRLAEKAAAQQGGDQPKPQLLNAMPPANSANKGKRMRDTTTGKILRSNGMQWTEE